MIVVCLFLVVPCVCLQFVIVVFPDHTQILFLTRYIIKIQIDFLCQIKLAKIACNVYNNMFPCYGLGLVCFIFVALCPKSTAMVIVRRSIHITTLYLSKLVQAVNQAFMHIILLVTDKIPS